MLDAAGGEIKALYVMGANPASERPAWNKQLDKLDLLIVQDIFLTETAQKADVVLPAVSWAESDGTFTNLERRVQRAPTAVRDPQSKAAPDWMILDHLAERMGANWSHADARAVTDEIATVVPIYEGLTWEALGDQGLQWDAAGVRARPAYRKVTQPDLAESGEQEFALVTGSVLFDGGELFSRTEQMAGMARGAVISVHPVDAAKVGMNEGASVIISNGNGQLTLVVSLDETVQRGTVWIPDSLPAAPVGTLLNGREVETVQIQLGTSLGT
ncbi:MAG: molybdopterin-dependent oxidoreductase [Caldilineaceae bacterium]|nr:molybdopterin-dependent oxidoreductase [Caldilineaceae bacterium]